MSLTGIIARIIAYVAAASAVEVAWHGRHAAAGWWHQMVGEDPVLAWQGDVVVRGQPWESEGAGGQPPRPGQVPASRQAVFADADFCVSCLSCETVLAAERRERALFESLAVVDWRDREHLTAASAAALGLGRIVALYHRSASLYTRFTNIFGG
jgi:hypothetical protein